MIDLADIPVVDFTEQTTLRLISTAYIDEPALSPLADSEEELNILSEVEMMTSARHNSLVAVPAGVDPTELLSGINGFGSTYVNAAFCYTRKTGNRFNSSERGAWYASYGDNAAKTCQAEIAFHLTRELNNVGVYENITNYREILAGFTTTFYDLGSNEAEDYLQPEPDIAYPAGQILARNILQNGGNGVLYPSSRYRDGQCLAAFRPHIIQNVRDGDVWQFEWSGKPEPVIRPV
ncbi:MAG: RES family NAD+ phosphorylase [Rhizobiaceae bacterium]